MVYTFPDNYDDAPCYLVAINATLIPFVAGALKKFEERRSWHSDEEHQQAYNAFTELEICMTKLCLEQLLESNDRIYRMISTAIYGTEYSVVTSVPLVVSPAIGPTHALTIERPDSILGRMEDQRQLLQNALNGTDTPNYGRADGVRDLLELIKTAIEANGGLDDDMLAKLGEIAVLLA